MVFQSGQELRLFCFQSEKLNNFFNTLIQNDFFFFLLSVCLLNSILFLVLRIRHHYNLQLLVVAQPWGNSTVVKSVVTKMHFCMNCLSKVFPSHLKKCFSLQRPPLHAAKESAALTLDRLTLGQRSQIYSPDITKTNKPW